MIYLVILIILFVGLRFDKVIWNKQSTHFFRFEWVVLFLFSGLRYRVGGDTMSYMDGYAFLPTIGELTWQDALINIWGYQPLYLYLVSACRSISEEFILFQLVHSFIVNTTVFWLIKKYAKRPFLVVTLYFVLSFTNWNMEIMKQSLTNCCFLLSIPYLINKQWKKYFVYALVGFGFHAAGFVLFIIPLVFHSIGEKNTIRYILYVGVGLFLISHLSFIQNILNELGLYSISSDIEFYGDKVSNVFGFIYGLVTAFFIPFLFLIYYKGDSKAEQSFTALYVILVGLSVSLAFLYRITDMIEIPFFIAITNYIKEYKNRRLLDVAYGNYAKNKKSYKLAIAVLVVLIASEFSFYNQDYTAKIGTPAYRYDLYLPYTSIFNPQEMPVREALYNDFVND